MVEGLKSARFTVEETEAPRTLSSTSLPPLSGGCGVNLHPTTFQLRSLCVATGAFWSCQLEAKALREPLKNAFEYNSGSGTVAGLCGQMAAAVALGKEVLLAVTLLFKKLQCRLVL